MITNLFTRSTLHEHAEPAQRVLGVAQLASDSDELARLLTADPAPEVRAAAARRCADLAVLAPAWENETDPAVRDALASALGGALADTQDSASARALLEGIIAPMQSAPRWHTARSMRNAAASRSPAYALEEPLIELALAAEHAETRMAAAERVVSPDGLRKLAAAAKNRDHGVARLARQRIDAMEERLDQKAEADAILAQLEALAVKPGPILTAVVELNRRWQALDMSGDTARLARCEAARQAVLARFEREQEEQRARARFERGVREWLAALAPPAAADALGGLRTELAALGATRRSGAATARARATG